jgi:tRNA(Arg) A34 adenosine deaminase TadA
MAEPFDSDVRWLRRAVVLSEQARSAGDEPFGALLLSTGGVPLAEERNTVVTDRDVSAHPELKLAVWAGRHLDPEVARLATVYASCETCAMCSAALVWSSIGTLVFALGSETLAELQGPQHARLALSARDVFARASRQVAVRGPLLEDEARLAHAGYWA